MAQKKDPPGSFFSFCLAGGSLRLFACPDICGLSAQLDADSNERDQNHGLDRDRRDRPLDAEGDVVEETVARCRRVKLEYRVWDDVPAVGKSRENALREVPAGMRRHRHPQTVKIVNHRTEEQTRHDEIHDRHK